MERDRERERERSNEGEKVNTYVDSWIIARMIICGEI